LLQKEYHKQNTQELIFSFHFLK